MTFDVIMKGNSHMTADNKSYLCSMYGKGNPCLGVAWQLKVGRLDPYLFSSNPAAIGSIIFGLLGQHLGE